MVSLKRLNQFEEYFAATRIIVPREQALKYTPLFGKIHPATAPIDAASTLITGKDMYGTKQEGAWNRVISPIITLATFSTSMSTQIGLIKETNTIIITTFSLDILNNGTNIFLYNN